MKRKDLHLVGKHVNGIQVLNESVKCLSLIILLCYANSVKFSNKWKDSCHPPEKKEIDVLFEPRRATMGGVSGVDGLPGTVSYWWAHWCRPDSCRIKPT